ncbi:efflux RND transporter periplasmic adaptor subunit [Sphingomonas sp. H39-1-10]|uniref:efflux RND transporter periplasmic adaptor subunit n=1 Tax=Sphingomonas TaxID=13687 RepID=UPI00087FCB40|nr:MULTISPECIES: efflux RND transporter periplasmic adaptor subunit [Sphingomonas]MDF0488098.1 efflux RND transporter periplasmic adaptor subunit [Sphingomonas pollutisoli]SDA33447.1 RND family efflux transporter, MFP subunit [Sphingomonas sp. NFR15]
MPEGDARNLKRIGIIGVVAAVAVVGAGIAARSHSETELATWTSTQAVPTVTVIRPSVSKGTGALVLPGQLAALQSAPIFARTSGYIRKWYVDIGDDVRRGQVLAVLDAPEVDQQLAAAQADYQTARANQQLAASTATRWKTMLAKDAVSKQETDEKVGDLAAKTALANAASANVNRLRYTQGFTRLIAPFSGVVTTRSTNVGTLVTAGSAASTPLFTVSDISRIRIYVKVPQAYSAQVHPGMDVKLTLPEYPGRTFTATMTRSADAVDTSSGTVLVELQAPNGDRALKPGAYAQASFPVSGSGGAVELPASAMIVGQNGTQVAVVGNDGRAMLKTVTIAHDLGDRVQISAGLSATDRVIDSPPDSLQSGDKVQIAQRQGAAGGK